MEAKQGDGDKTEPIGLAYKLISDGEWQLISRIGETNGQVQPEMPLLQVLYSPSSSEADEEQQVTALQRFYAERLRQQELEKQNFERHLQQELSQQQSERRRARTGEDGLPTFQPDITLPWNEFASTLERPFAHVMLGHSLSQAQTKAREYLRSFPGSDQALENYALHQACRRLIYGEIQAPEKVESILKQVEFRMEKIMKKATMYKNMLGIDFLSCENFDAFESCRIESAQAPWTIDSDLDFATDSSGLCFREIEADCFQKAYGRVAMAGLFDPPTREQGPPYNKGIKYLSRMMASQLWSIESMNEAIRSLQPRPSQPVDRHFVTEGFERLFLTPSSPDSAGEASASPSPPMQPPMMVDRNMFRCQGLQGPPPGQWYYHPRYNTKSEGSTTSL